MKQKVFFVVCMLMLSGCPEDDQSTSGPPVYDDYSSVVNDLVLESATDAWNLYLEEEEVDAFISGS